MGVVSTNVKLNVNRQAKRLPKPTEPMLAVMRFDDEAGRPIAVLVNYAAHPTITNNKLMKYSRRLSRLHEAESRGRAAHELRLHPGGRRRHERQRQIARSPAMAKCWPTAVIPLARGARTEVPNILDRRQSRCVSVHLRPRPAAPDPGTARPETPPNREAATPPCGNVLPCSSKTACRPS